MLNIVDNYCGFFILCQTKLHFGAAWLTEQINQQHIVLADANFNRSHPSRGDTLSLHCALAKLRRSV